MGPDSANVPMKPFALFPFLYIGSSFYYKRRPLRPMEMDFVSGLKEIEAATYDDPPPRNWVERFWAWLVSCKKFIDQCFPLTHLYRCNCTSLISF